jgi:uncharacterized protein YegP (UPF0339 family)
MAHRLELDNAMAGGFAGRFKVNRETIFATEGYASKSSANNRKALAFLADAAARAC